MGRGSASRFAEACEHAAVKFRMEGASLGERDDGEWMALFLHHLRQHLRLRAAASQGDAASRRREGLLGDRRGVR
jgi:hypothetical protein